MLSNCTFYLFCSSTGLSASRGQGPLHDTHSRAAKVEQGSWLLSRPWPGIPPSGPLCIATRMDCTSHGNSYCSAIPTLLENVLPESTTYSFLSTSLPLLLTASSPNCSAECCVYRVLLFVLDSLEGVRKREMVSTEQIFVYTYIYFSYKISKEE